MYFLNLFPETLHVSADVSHHQVYATSSRKHIISVLQRRSSMPLQNYIRTRRNQTTEDQELQKQGQYFLNKEIGNTWFLRFVPIFTKKTTILLLLLVTNTTILSCLANTTTSHLTRR
jgi:hypothetical protein